MISNFSLACEDGYFQAPTVKGTRRVSKNRAEEVFHSLKLLFYVFRFKFWKEKCLLNICLILGAAIYVSLGLGLFPLIS